MLITSSKISSHVASTTPTAFIALLQLLGCKEAINDGCVTSFETVKSNHANKARQKHFLQGSQLQEALQKCEVLPILERKPIYQFLTLQNSQ